MTEAQLITTLYRAFQQLDYQTMADCYHPEARFHDEAFTLEGQQVAAMWQMLSERAQNMTLEFSVYEINGKVTARWEPRYTFSQTGRRVHNIITAEFEFKDGKIITHTDRFNFWRWSYQALGFPGLLLGWTPFLRQKVSRMAMGSLNDFMTSNHYQ